MNTFDIIVLIVFGYSIIQGILKGFVNQLAQIVAYVLGIFIAFHFSNIVSEWINTQFDINSSYTYLIAFGILLIGTVVVVFFISSKVNIVLRILQLNILNRVVGMFFSIIKVTLLLSLITLAIQKLDSAEIIMSKKQREESILFKPLLDVGNVVFPFISEKWKTISPSIEEQLHTHNDFET